MIFTNSVFLQLSVEYKEKRKLVDEIKDDLQARIAEYSKMTENGG